MSATRRFRPLPQSPHPVYNRTHEHTPAPQPQGHRAWRRRLRSIRRAYAGRAWRRRGKGRAAHRRLDSLDRPVPGRRPSPGKVRAVPLHEHRKARRYTRSELRSGPPPTAATGLRSPHRDRQPSRRLAGRTRRRLRRSKRGEIRRDSHPDHTVRRLGTSRRIRRRGPVVVPHQRERSRDTRPRRGPELRAADTRRRTAGRAGRRRYRLDRHSRRAVPASDDGAAAATSSSRASKPWRPRRSPA